jgi:lysophospholipase L1-like esterase
VQGANIVPLGINFVTASLLHAFIRHSIFIADDRRTAITLSTNGLSQTTLGTGGVGAQIAQTGTDFNNTGASLGISARGNIAFATYSAAPVVETVLMDFSQPVELRFELNIASSDCCQFGGAMVTMYKATSDNYAPSMSIMCIGDSLTDGTGSSAVSSAPMDYPAQLRRTRSGAPLVKMGYGGNAAQQVVDKVIVTDVNRAQRWKALIWLGTNDFVADGPTWWAAVKPQLDRALSLRGNKPTIFGNFHPRASWSVGDASYVAMQYINAQMAATYDTAAMNALGIGVADLFTALATNAGKVPAASMYDDVHLTNAGYTTVAATFNSKITALGWA